MVEGTESVWRRNGEMWWKEWRVCGVGTESCGGRNGECADEEQRDVVKGTESVWMRSREMW